MRLITPAGSALFVVFSLLPSARADDPFQISAQSTSGPPVTSTVNGSNLPRLLNDLIKGKDGFSSLRNVSSTASVRYGTENNAIVVTRNAGGTAASVSIPSINFKRNFTGTDSADLERHVEKFFRKDGADTYGKFVESVNQRTTLGVVDGNPLAATAVFANQPYVQFGLQPAPTPPGEHAVNRLDQVATPNLRLDVNGGYSHSDSGNGYYAGGAFSFGAKLGDRVGLVSTTPFEYRYVAGATAYDVAEEVSLPVVLLPPRGRASLDWMLTPTVFAGGAGSVDLAAGGVFLGGGLTSSLSLRFAGFIFTLADEINYAHGFPITVGDYKFDTRVEQEVAKNGVKITRFIGNDLYVDAGITYTEFLRKAAVGEYWTPTAGIGVRLGPGAGLRMGYSGDFGPGFIDHGGALQFYLNY